MVITDWNGNAICIVDIDCIEECKYFDVSAEFAYLEGEGNRSLEWWEKAHWDFFAKECKEFNIEVSENMVLILEKFLVVYK